jgi:hypothetical protein
VDVDGIMEASEVVESHAIFRNSLKQMFDPVDWFGCYVGGC